MTALPKILVSEEGEFVDGEGNSIVLRGVNLDPLIKIPRSPFQPTYQGTGDLKAYFDGAPGVNFIDHPMPLEDVNEHITKLKSLGFNCIRVPFTWESFEHKGPGEYDFAYMDYMIELFLRIKEMGGMYLYLDPHQDVWSRFCGGSGAPLWTLYCAGFDPMFFKETEASILHNHYDNISDPSSYPKMLWATNYYRLACQTMFTLFFAGKEFAPKCCLNGVNIQDYLQQKFLDSVMTFVERIKKKAPELYEENCIIGLETVNEPNIGYLATKDLATVPKERNLKRGTTPTAFQSFALGEGFEALVDEYDITIFGPSKVGTKKIDPKGITCWLTKEDRNEIDSRYGWERDPAWLPGQCIWRLHGVWEVSPNNEPRLILHDYFASTRSGAPQLLNYKYFINHYFVDYYKKYHERLRLIDKELFLFLQPPPFQGPPDLKGSELLDRRTIYSCHFYDGMSLMFKTWNRKFNVDTLGIVRGKYMNPVFSIVVGEQNIRKSLRKQLKEMKQEVKDSLGIPVFFTEIGMPFDMDDKKAYINKDFSSQTSALDALQYALEGENISYSLWCYCSKNSHKWGDLWNNEDFSIWSADDKSTEPGDTKSKDTSDFIPLVANELNPEPCVRSEFLDFNGFRALEAILRPFPVKIHGKFVTSEFNLASKIYRLEILGKTDSGLNPNSATYIFLPRKHFPLKNVSIQSSSGRFTFDADYQVLKWSHDPGNQHITISLVADKDDSPRDGSPDCVIS